MIDRLFSDPSYIQMKQSLDVEAARHSCIAHNIANVNTPGYKAKRLVSAEPGGSRFSHHLSQAETKRGRELALSHLGSRFRHPRHMPLESGVPEAADESFDVTEDEFAIPRNDGNTVDIYQEMARLTESQMRYQALALMVSGRLITLRKVINEGRTGR